MQLFFVYIPLYTFIYPPPIFRQSPVRSASAPYYLLVPLPQQYRCHGNIRHPFCKKDDMAGKSAYNTNSSNADNKKHKLFP